MFERDAKLNMILNFGTVGVGILISLLIPSAARNQGAFAWGALLLYVLGFIAFASAKVHQFRKGILISVGTRGMAQGQVLAYRIGYALMGAGFLATIALLVVSAR